MRATKIEKSNTKMTMNMQTTRKLVTLLDVRIEREKKI